MKLHGMTGTHGLPICRLACAIGVALSLVACGGGGGGGNVRPSPAASTPPTPPPAPPPAPPPSPPPAPPPASTAPSPPLDAQLSITNTYAAHKQGFTGAGVTIGVVDSGIMRSNPTVAGRVTQEFIDVDPSQNNVNVDDVVGHGTWVAGMAAGAPFAAFPGGIAPGASLVSARIISDKAPDDNGSSPPSTVTAADAQFFGQVNQQLIGANVNVMNNSWGGITWDTTNTSVNQAFDQAYSPFINQQNGIVVFAAGNDSQANPSTIAALPTVAPDLAKGWLVAVAVNSNNPTQLDSYSNQCGVAMNFCLAAPGDVIVLDKGTTSSTTNPTYWQVGGTSFAAPQVSGAAALVWQAYPYFSNDLVRQTLLGTADPLGGTQPNPTFGYGELDVGRAVNGPMQFNWGDVTVSFSGNSNWNNPISGAGGLIKQGAGTLNLTQPSSFTGLTQVQGGALIAQSLAGAANISSGAALGVVNSVGGDVANAGTLAIAGSGLNVGGNYTQQSTGQLALPLGSVLNVAGTATLAGNLQVTGENSGYTPNAKTDVLVAQKGLTGTFGALTTTSNVLLTASLNYSGTTAWLNVQQVQVTAAQGASFSVAAYGAAQRVDAAFGQINTQLLMGTGGASGSPLPADFMVGAASLQHTPNVAALESSMESLSGQLHAASAAMTFEAIDAGTRALSARFDQLLDVPQPGVWAQNLNYQGNLSRSGFGTVGYNLGGMLAGRDFRVDGSGVAGFAVSQSQGTGWLTAGRDQSYNRAVEGMVYGGTVRGNWYAMGRVGVGNFQQSMRRLLQLGSGYSGVASDSRGRYSLAYGESGYRMHVGGFQLTPYTSLEYAQIRNSGFDELGGDGFGLKSGSLTTSRWQSTLGLRAGRGWWLPKWGYVSLQARLAWQESFGLRGEAFDASFSGLDQWAPLGGIGLSRYGGMAGATLNWTMSPRSSLMLDYGRYFGQYQRSTAAMLDYRWSF